MVFKRLSEFAIRVAELMEAEGRELRTIVARLGLGFSIVLVAAALLFVGASLLLAAIWLGMREPVGPAWASAITGVVALFMAGGALMAAIKVHK